jgi:hypothetical protein
MFPNLGKSYKVEWLQFKSSPLAISATAAGEIEKMVGVLTPIDPRS